MSHPSVSDTSGSSFEYKNAVFKCVQEKESILIEKSVARDHCLSSLGSLVMPIGDPRDGFFYLTLILIIDSCRLSPSAL